MLTDISHDLFYHFLGKSDVNSLLRNKLIYQLYQTLNNPYENTKIKVSTTSGSYPVSDFIANSLSAKLSERTNLMTLNWTTTCRGKHSVKNTLNIYSLPDDNTDTNTKLLVRAISFITSFSDSPREIIVNLCLLPNKKIIRKNQSKITKLNVNSGSNYFSEYTSEICVFRREEAIKVIFHEIIHGLRFSVLGHHDDITERICQKYNLDSKDILIDESYTEIWAKLFNCYFISSLTNSTSKFQHFCTLLAVEQEFNIYQGSKVKLFTKNTKDKNIDKDTNVSAYYLVVAEIFSNLIDFLNMCDMNPYVKDKQKTLEYFYHLPPAKKRKVSHNDPYYNTMRMSAAELEI
tara:strand:- start:52 stop:1092 length:1041 start_codon:yes stop_codon:yes gene_type:complete